MKNNQLLFILEHNRQDVMDHLRMVSELAVETEGGETLRPGNRHVSSDATVVCYLQPVVWQCAPVPLGPSFQPPPPCAPPLRWASGILNNKKKNKIQN